jgi:hypothetical protein
MGAVLECVIVLWGEGLVEGVGVKKTFGMAVGVQCFVAMFGVMFLCGLF